MRWQKMKNKVLICLIVPDIDKKYDVYIPINKKIGNIIALLGRAVQDLNPGEFTFNNKIQIYNQKSGIRYDLNQIVKNTDIRNGTGLVLM